MNWLARLLAHQGPKLNAAQQDKIAAISALPAPDLGLAHYETRYVAVNVEASATEGGNPQLLGFGAVAINRGLITPDDVFQTSTGAEPANALISLLKFIAHAPVVVFNAPFNQGLLERAFEQELGNRLELEWLDLMVLMPTLCPERIEGQTRMDAWLGAFGIERLDIRNPLLEALAVAQLHQVAIARANGQGMPTPRDLLETQNSRKWLRGS